MQRGVGLDISCFVNMHNKVHSVIDAFSSIQALYRVPDHWIVSAYLPTSKPTLTRSRCLACL